MRKSMLGLHLLVLGVLLGNQLKAQPIVDFILLEHKDASGQQMIWVMGTHPDGRTFSANYQPDEAALKIHSLAADHVLIQQIIGVKDLNSASYNDQALDFYERLFGKRIRRGWEAPQTWALYNLFRQNHRQIVELYGIKARVTLLNRYSAEDLNEYESLYQHISTYRGQSLANLPAPHADILIHFLIGEYGYEAVEFDRQKWQTGRIDTVYVAKETPFSTIGFGFNEKLLIYLFLGILIFLLAMIAWLLTKFMHFRKEVSKALQYNNRQLKSIDEMQIQREDSDQLLRMVQLMIKYRQADIDVSDEELAERLLRKR